MKLTDKVVVHTAKLANLSLSSEEVSTYKEQLSKIIDFFEELSNQNTEAVQATSQTTGLTNIYRDDIANSSRTLSQQDALFGTEKTHNGHFVVPILLKHK